MASAGQRVWAGLVPADGQGRARDASHFDVSHRQLLKLAYSKFDLVRPDRPAAECTPWQHLLSASVCLQRFACIIQSAMARGAPLGPPSSQQQPQQLPSLPCSSPTAPPRPACSAPLPPCLSSPSSSPQDGDGELERDEVMAMLGELGFSMSGMVRDAQQLVNELFEKHDTDGNGARAAAVLQL